ncbi:hypothetical protein LPB136_11770 [Tenacibaculum todarodis]|uniref:Uncharacterized protein n=1 Tax=Tenacibaculum todarodis TaxID=1850252 RepID=A0A1L3JLK4_9FLAO|nr:hypothetical protein [Tenacibaculum todarodis]APG66001.1 hypothetical protein LPB136_11770 [Tenacibaculum todarodis]
MPESRKKPSILLYNNRKLIASIGVLFIIIGLITAYFYWGIEPHETISGALCGFGLMISIIFFTLKKPIN